MTKKTTDLLITTPEKGQTYLEARVANVKKLKITDDASMEVAVNELSEINKIADAAESEKEKVTKPINEALKAERSRWKPLEAACDEAVTFLRGMISTYQTAKRKAEQEEEAKIAARVGEGKGKFTAETAVRKMEEIDKAPKQVATNAGSVKFRTDRVLKINDEVLIKQYIMKSGDFSFMTLNESKLKAALLDGKTIPGAVIDTIETPINSR